MAMIGVESSNKAVILSSVLGILLSTYALHVELALLQDPQYRAMCDISEHMSCTKVLGSPYGKGFGIVEKTLGSSSAWNVPNCALGIVFYSIVIVLSLVDATWAGQIQFVLCALSNVTSVYLAYLLAFVLHDLCVVCVATYLVNAANAAFSYCKLRAMRQRNYRHKYKSN